MSQRRSAAALAVLVIVFKSAPNSPASVDGMVRSESAISRSNDGHRLPLSVARDNLQTTLQRLPLSFEANAGQLDDEVRYVARGSDVDLFLTNSEVVFVHRRPTNGIERQPHAVFAGRIRSDGAGASITRMRFVGSRRKFDVQAFDAQPGVVNYLTGRNPKAWVTGATTFGRARYSEVWKGIDVVFHGQRERLEYDFEVAPGASHKQIELAFIGADHLVLDAEGNLVVTNNGARQTHRAPTVIEDPYGPRSKRLAGRFVLRGTDRVGFELENRDERLGLLIDPEVVYATPLFGGSNIDNVFSLDVGDDGRVTIAGYTESLDFPGTRPSAYQPFNQSSPPGHSAGVVSRLSEDGSRIEWTTYLSGSTSEFTAIWRARVDRAGFVYIGGFTTSSDFPTTTNAFDPIFDGFSEGIVAVLTPNGANLVYSSFLGGSEYDALFGLALLHESVSSGRGRVLMAVTGDTASSDFPLVNAEAALVSQSDAFVSVVDPTGGGLVYSSRIPGGDWNEVGLDIAGHGDTLAVIGVTSSTPRPRIVAWHHAVEGSRGVAQLSASNPSWASAGYDNFWNQVLTKPFILPAGQVAAILVVRWQTEEEFDFLRLRISADGGARWVTLAQFDGFSNGFESASVDLTAYAGQSVLLQFQLFSDEFVSDQDGGIDTDGSAIDSITVTGFATDDFETGLDGWVQDDAARALPAEAHHGPLGGTTDTFVALVKPLEPSLRVSVIGGRGPDGAIPATNGNAKVTFAPDGTIVAVGITSSASFPTTASAYQRTRPGPVPLWVGRLTSDLSQLLAATYLGGNGFEFPNGLAVDANGRVIITGISESSNYPVVDPIDLRPLLGPGGGGNDRDYVFSILSADLSQLVHSTRLGDVGWELGGEVGLGTDGSIYVLGRKRLGGENAGPTQDVFVIKLRP